MQNIIKGKTWRQFFFGSFIIFGDYCNEIINLCVCACVKCTSILTNVKAKRQGEKDVLHIKSWHDDDGPLKWSK
jgi:hypothetical protein